MKSKSIINTLLVLILLISFSWGVVVRGLGNWGARSASVSWDNDILWANICQFVIPIFIVIVLIFINRKR